MSPWHLRKADGSVFGPVDESTLREWAIDGRVAPDDEISQDQAQWRRAAEAEWLEMWWEVPVEGGGMFGPVHALALCDALETGSLTLDTPLRDARTGQSRQAGEVVLNALLSERAAWRAAIERERAAAAAREADLKQKLDKVRRLQAALAENLKNLEQKLAAGGEAADAAGRVERLEKELAEVKAELDVERRRLREEREAWQERVRRLTQEKQDLEKQLGRPLSAGEAMPQASGSTAASGAAPSPAPPVAPATPEEEKPGGGAQTGAETKITIRIGPGGPERRRPAARRAPHAAKGQPGLSSDQMPRGPGRPT